MHHTLARHLKRRGLAESSPPNGTAWREFIAVVDRVYEERDRERYLAERAMTLVSSELRAHNAAADRRNSILATLLDSLSIGVCFADRDGTVHVCNRKLQEILGLDPSGQNLLTLLAGIQPTAGQERHPATALRRAMEDAETLHLPSVVFDRSGVPRHLSIRVSPSDCGRIVLNIEDTTESVSTEQQHRLIERRLEQQQRLETVGRLASGIAHDFNNILAGILVCTELLDHVEGEAAEDVAEIRRSAQRGADMTRRLLAFSRQDADDPAMIDANDVLRGLIGMLSRLVGRIQLETSFAPDSCLVLMDASDLEQVLMNLVVNAQHAIEDRGTIVIETERTTIDSTNAQRFELPPGDYVQIKVSDNGCGMTAATLDRIFEPFFTTRPQGVGNGLGLATVHGMVTRMGGRICVYSEPGLGTTFRILLPAAGDPEIVDDAPTVTSPTPSLRVLLLEDDVQLRQGTARMLEESGHRVHDTGTVEDARRALETRPFDAVVADLVIDGQEAGFALATEARTRDPEIGVVIVSGFSEKLHKLALGDRMEFLEKPVLTDVLMQSLRAVSSPSASLSPDP